MLYLIEMLRVANEVSYLPHLLWGYHIKIMIVNSEYYGTFNFN